MTATLRRRWWLVWFAFAIILTAAALLFDASVQTWFTEIQTPGGNAFMRHVSRWGDWPAHVIVGLAGLGIAYLRKSRTWMAIFAATVLACAAAGLANRAVKMTAGRSRPSVKIDVGWNGPRFSPKYHAFPSGHTAASTAFFATLVFARRRIGIALLPIPLLIATSRLYLNAHHFSDVVVGALVGVFFAALVWRFLQDRSSSLSGEPDGLPMQR